MKLKLNFDQAAQILRNHFNLPSDAEIVIQRVQKAPFGPIRTMINDIGAMRYTYDEKIPAINLSWWFGRG
jgi:hypothetical protein